jgi:tetratricopeptide (TPR) repeat protein
MRTIALLLALTALHLTVYAGVDLTSARLYKKQGELLKSAEYFNKAAAAEPDNLEVYFERGALLGDLAGNPNLADIAKQVAGDVPDVAKELYTRMVADFKRAQEVKTPDDEKTLKKFKKKLDEYANQKWNDFYFSAVAIDSPYTRKSAAELADTAKAQLKVALDKLDFAIMILPAKWNAHGQKAQVLEKLEQIAAANDCWVDALRLIQESDMPKKDAENYHQAVKVIRQHLLQNNYDLSHYTETVRIADEILAKDPESMDAVQYKAFALARLSVDTTKSDAERTEFKKQAVTALDNARKKTDDPVILYYMGQFHLQLGDTASALTAFGDYLKLEKNDKDVLFAMGVIYLEGGTFTSLEKARDTFKQVTEVAPEFAAGWINYGVALIRLGNNAEGRKAVEKGKSLPQ